MYKIYLDNKVIIFSATPHQCPDTDLCGELFMVERSTFNQDLQFTKLLQKVQFTKCLNVVAQEVDSAFSVFVQSARLVEAAGGVVRNDNGDFLMIFRGGKWDLPKGKMEQGESPAQCAVREVEEECSVWGIALGEFMMHTYHIYCIDGAAVLKRTWWYHMTISGDSTPLPQHQEGITKAEWVASNKVAALIEDSYGNIRDIFEDISEIVSPQTKKIL